MEAGRSPRTPGIIQGRGCNGKEHEEEWALKRCVKEVDLIKLDGG